MICRYCMPSTEPLYQRLLLLFDIAFPTPRQGSVTYGNNEMLHYSIIIDRAPQRSFPASHLDTMASDSDGLSCGTICPAPRTVANVSGPNVLVSPAFPSPSFNLHSRHSSAAYPSCPDHLARMDADQPSREGEGRWETRTPVCPRRACSRPSCTASRTCPRIRARARRARAAARRNAGLGVRTCRSAC